MHKNNNISDFEKCLAAKNDMELISIVADEYANRGLSRDELIEAGMDGIAKARKHYDEEQGFSFNAYAVWWVRQRMLQAIHEKE